MLQCFFFVFFFGGGGGGGGIALMLPVSLMSIKKCSVLFYKSMFHTFAQHIFRK